MTSFTPWSATLGGLLIGLAASALFLQGDRRAGVSGILGDALRLGAESGWRWLFLGGLLAGGLLLRLIYPTAFPEAIAASPALLVTAGLLVGFGTRLGSGCTSGHGICGLGEGSLRSLAATLTFMAAGVATVFVARHLLEGGLP